MNGTGSSIGKRTGRVPRQGGSPGDGHGRTWHSPGKSELGRYIATADAFVATYWFSGKDKSGCNSNEWKTSALLVNAAFPEAHFLLFI